VTPHFEQLHSVLKKLPGLGYRSSERLALHLLLDKKELVPSLIETLERASKAIGACNKCGNLAENELCEVCASPKRDLSTLCIIEQVPDLIAVERAGAYNGLYHVLRGKLSPIHGVGPEQLNLQNLRQRIQDDGIEEIILALGNDIEGEATCHFLQEEIFNGLDLSVSRIGFGLPSGGGLPFADATTLKSALDGRRNYQ